MYRFIIDHLNGRNQRGDFNTIIEAKAWLADQPIPEGSTVTPNDGEPLDVTAEYIAIAAEKAQDAEDFADLKNNVISKIDDGTLFSALSTAEKKVIKGLVRFCRG